MDILPGTMMLAALFNLGRSQQFTQMFNPDRHLYLEKGLALEPINKILFLSNTNLKRTYSFQFPILKTMEPKLGKTKINCHSTLKHIYMMEKALKFYTIQSNYLSLDDKPSQAFYSNFIKFKTQLQYNLRAMNPVNAPRGQTSDAKFSNYLLRKYLESTGSTDIENYFETHENKTQNQAGFAGWLDNIKNKDIESKGSNDIGFNTIILNLCEGLFSIQEGMVKSYIEIKTDYENVLGKMNLLLPQDKEKEKRSKRSLGSSIGSVFANLFDLSTVEDQNKLAEQVKHLQSVVAHTITDRTKLQGKLHSLSNYVDNRINNISMLMSESLTLISNKTTNLELELHQHMIRISDDKALDARIRQVLFNKVIKGFTNAISSLNDFGLQVTHIQRFITQIDMAISDITSGKVPHSLLDPLKIKNDVWQLNQELEGHPLFKGKLTLPKGLVNNIQSFSKVIGHSRNNTLDITLELPVAKKVSNKESNIYFQLFKLVVLPLQISAGKYSMLDLEEEMIAISNINFREGFHNKGLVIPLKRGDLGRCYGDRLLICKENLIPLTPHNFTNLCLEGILTLSISDLSRHLVNNCKFKIIEKSKTTMEQTTKIIQNYALFIDEGPLSIREETRYISDEIQGSGSVTFDDTETSPDDDISQAVTEGTEIEIRNTPVHEIIGKQCQGVCMLEIPCNSQLLYNRETVITQRFCSEIEPNITVKHLNIKPFNLIEEVVNVGMPFIKKKHPTIDIKKFSDDETISGMIKILKNPGKSAPVFSDTDWTEILDKDYIPIFNYGLETDMFNIGGGLFGFIEFIILSILVCYVRRHNSMLDRLYLASMTPKVSLSNGVYAVTIWNKIHNHDIKDRVDDGSAGNQTEFGYGLEDVLDKFTKGLDIRGKEIYFMVGAVILSTCGIILILVNSYTKMKYRKTKVRLLIFNKLEFVAVNLQDIRSHPDQILLKRTPNYQELALEKVKLENFLLILKSEFIITDLRSRQILTPSKIRISPWQYKKLKKIIKNEQFQSYLTLEYGGKTVAFLESKRDEIIPPRNMVQIFDLNRYVEERITHAKVFPIIKSAVKIPSAPEIRN